MFEKVLSLIERAVVALEKIAAAGVSATSAQPAAETPSKPAKTAKPVKETPPPAPPADDDFLSETPEPKPEPEPKFERADVKKALQEYGSKHGMDKAQELFKKISGVGALSELPIEKFAAVIAATKK